MITVEMIDVKAKLKSRLSETILLLLETQSRRGDGFVF